MGLSNPSEKISEKLFVFQWLRCLESNQTRIPVTHRNYSFFCCPVSASYFLKSSMISSPWSSSRPMRGRGLPDRIFIEIPGGYAISRRGQPDSLFFRRAAFKHTPIYCKSRARPCQPFSKPSNSLESLRKLFCKEL